MAVAFDFDDLEIKASLSGIAPVGSGGTPSVVTTVPLGTAAFPLQTGRVVEVEIVAAGQDSNDVPLHFYLRGCVSTSKPGASNSLSGSPYYDELHVSPSIHYPIDVDALTVSMNASNDMVVSWTNENTVVSGITQDVAVRIRLRWLGA